MIFKFLINLSFFIIVNVAEGKANDNNCFLDTGHECSINAEPCQDKSLCKASMCMYFVCDADPPSCEKCSSLTVDCDKDYEDDAFPSSDSLKSCTNTQNESFTLKLTGNNYRIIKNFSLANLNIIFLDINSNNIKEIEAAAFDSVIGLKVLDLSGNYLTRVYFGEFEKEIELLYLTDNELEMIVANSFWSLVNLKFLDLSMNKVEFIAKDAFVMNKLLQSLYLKINLLKRVDFTSQSLLSLNLAVNSLDEIKVTDIEGFDSIMNIIFDQNYITGIEKKSFASIAKTIVNISLNSNRLKLIDSDPFGDNFTCLKRLEMKGNIFETFSGGEYLASLTYLDIASNFINTIEPRTFAHLKYLTYLDLSNLMLTKINETNAFSGLTSLTTLYLCNNSIMSLEDGMFLELFSLSLLDVSANMIKIIEKNAFSGLSKLRILDLSTNLLPRLEACQFEHLNSLNLLNIAANKIRSIQENAFSGVNDSLEILNFYSNKLQFVKNYHFKDLTKLIELDLSNNQISSIEADSFLNLLDLKLLDLAKNLIFRIDSNLFRKLEKLSELDLSFNLIKKLDIGTFKYLGNLSIVDLSDNFISTLGRNLFGSMVNLRSLDLSENIINEIDFTCFENFVNLETLKLDNVRSSVKVKSVGNIIHFWNLKYLQLQGSKLELVRQFNFSNLETLNLQNAELSSDLIKTIPARSIKSLDLRNIKFNGTIDLILDIFKENIIELDLSDARLSRDFQSTILNESFNLRKLNLSNCNCVGNLTLVYYEKLVHLDLSFNKIDFLRRRFLFFNKNLESVNLSNNYLLVIKKEYFQGLTKLKSLDLSYNKINKLEKAAFQDQFNINELILRNNQIKNINPDIFETNHLEFLWYLNLMNNPMLSEVHFFVYSNWFYYVNYEGCSIGAIDFKKLVGDPFIRLLNLKRNKIRFVENTTFENTDFIVELLLSANLIESIDENAFNDLNELIVLDLSQNKLTALQNETFSGLLQLKYLNLSHNNIEWVNRALLSRLKQLEFLDLSWNSISKMDAFSFSCNNVLRIIIISQNNFTEFFTDQILDGLHDESDFIYISQRVEMSLNSCVIIKEKLGPLVFNKNSDIQFYDATAILTRTDDPRDDRLKSYTFDQCIYILYLVRNHVEYNVNDHQDIELFLGQCTARLSKLRGKLKYFLPFF